MATYFTDFDEFSTGNTSTNLTGFTTTLATDWTSTIIDQGGGDHAVRFTNVGPTGDGVTTVVYDAFDTAGAVEAYATIITGTTSDQNAQIGPALIASDNRCYGLRPNAAATATTWRLALFSSTGSISSSIGTAFSFTEPAAGTLYHAVVGRDASNNIYAYMWLDGASRPGSPLASASNTTLTNVKPGLTARDSSDDPMTFTRFGAGTGGDAAPESDPGGGGGGSHPNKFFGKFGGKLVGKAA